MNATSETQPFDAFGEKTPSLRIGAGTVTERRARKLGIAIFWSLALLIVAGRVYYAPLMPMPIELASR